MQMGQTKFGMQTLNQALVKLIRDRMITREEAMAHAGDVEELGNMLTQAGL
jgi:twitching motility protein PilT